MIQARGARIQQILHEGIHKGVKAYEKNNMFNACADSYCFFSLRKRCR